MWFDFHGECDLVLLQAQNFDGLGKDLNLHIRTTIRYDYSYISSAALQIGADVLEVGSYGDFVLNGVSSANVGHHGKAGMLDQYVIYKSQPEAKKNRFDIVLSDVVGGPNITISTYKDIVAVSLNAGDAKSANYFGLSKGLMGSFSGTLLARDGATVMEDMNAFGQEWQVRDTEPMLFQADREPQYPRQCVLPSTKSTNKRRLGETVAKQAAENACSHVVNYAMFQQCAMDVMATGDFEMANNYAN